MFENKILRILHESEKYGTCTEKSETFSTLEENIEPEGENSHSEEILNPKQKIRIPRKMGP